MQATRPAIVIKQAQQTQFDPVYVANKVFVLPNGQKCFIAESGVIFCTDEKGVYRPIGEMKDGL